ncbi:hypothetical protein [Prauserella rugosa]|uniref:hypothetical protein n=1 Tax=Prauserella rugosa TaxID=43354 RepID=UPI00068CF40E|nr:hypothetical protein [Prauserella rugosa]
MSVTDPADARLLTVVADLGRASLTDIAARAGMDPREAAHRLLNLSASGLPLTVGVEADGTRLRNALGGATGGQHPPTAHRPAQPAPAQAGTAQPGPVRSPASAQQDAAQPAPQTPAHGSPQNPTPAPAVPLDPAISTWGPPQSSSWTRRDNGGRLR